MKRKTIKVERKCQSLSLSNSTLFTMQQLIILQLKSNYLWLTWELGVAEWRELYTLTHQATNLSSTTLITGSSLATTDSNCLQILIYDPSNVEEECHNYNNYIAKHQWKWSASVVGTWILIKSISIWWTIANCYLTCMSANKIQTLSPVISS